MDSAEVNGHMLIGTYTKTEGHVDGKGAGIYIASVADDGSLTLLDSVMGPVNPSFIAIHPSGNQLYAVNEIGGADASRGMITSYDIDRRSRLSERASKKTSGTYPCHISTDSSGTFVFVANYRGGAVDIYKLEEGVLTRADSILLSGGSDHPRQESSHPHMVTSVPGTDQIAVVDLGSDRIWRFIIDRNTGKASPAEDQPFVSLAKYDGPRHMIFHPNKPAAYVANELSNTVAVVSTGGDSWEVVQAISTLPSDYDRENSVADIHIHPSGEFLYVSNRGDNTIVTYRISDGGTKLTFQGYTSTRGRYPRNFLVDPSGRYMYVANQNSNTVGLFDIDSTSRLPIFREQIKVATPVCLKLMP